MLNTLKKISPLLPAIAIFIYFTEQLNFTQDDAYITYRYIENFLNGDGLVFNIGERVEGITNLGWALYLSMTAGLGLNYILMSKLTGFLAGFLIIVLTYLIAQKIFTEKPLLTYLTVYLVAVNQSLAYWSISGLETSVFALLVMLSVYFFMTENKLLIFTLALSVFVRPEGALVAGILIVLDTINKKSFVTFALKSTIVAFIISIPFVLFKLFYYHAIIPNPFYAKTGFSIDKLYFGLEYFYRFLTHYGFYGIGLVVPLLFYKKLSKHFKIIWVFTIIYMLYIILVGGDVLKVHRFFLPLFCFNSILIIYALDALFGRFNRKLANTLFCATGIVLISLTYYLPDKFISDYNYLEKVFVKNMDVVSNKLKMIDNTNFSVATPTIGILGYNLIGHDIIDMVGLCDSTIARHPEKVIPNLSSTWKEQKYNSKYVLSRKPDYILFSTNSKPSAPAEKALLLYPQFLDAYRTIGWIEGMTDYYQGKIFLVFKKTKDYTGEIEPKYPIEFVDNYKLGIESKNKNKLKESIEYYDRAISLSPDPVYVYLLYEKAYSLLLLNEPLEASKIMDTIIARDSTVFIAHASLYILNKTTLRDDKKAEIHKRWIKKLNPWIWEDTQRIVMKYLKRNG